MQDCDHWEKKKKWVLQLFQISAWSHIPECCTERGIPNRTQESHWIFLSEIKKREVVGIMDESFSIQLQAEKNALEIFRGLLTFYWILSHLSTWWNSERLNKEKLRSGKQPIPRAFIGLGDIQTLISESGDSLLVTNSIQ